MIFVSYKSDSRAWVTYKCIKTARHQTDLITWWCKDNGKHNGQPMKILTNKIQGNSRWSNLICYPVMQKWIQNKKIKREFYVLTNEHLMIYLPLFHQLVSFKPKTCQTCFISLYSKRHPKLPFPVFKKYFIDTYCCFILFHLHLRLGIKHIECWKTLL